MKLDLADVQRMIAIRALPLEFVVQLDPYVKSKYEELWHSAQHPLEDY